jgi:DNA ligase (NAD+)
MEYSDLELKIISASKSYYEGQAFITDEEFDNLVEILKIQNPNSEILQSVGWGYKPEEKSKSRHIGSLVGSINSKFKYNENIPYDFTKNVIISPKFDGGSFVLYYQNGILIKALSRGDGLNGRVCTNKIKYILEKYNIHNLPKGLLSIRGECIIPIKYEQELKNRDIPSPRNYVSGILNRDEITKDLDMVEFIPYSIRILEDKSYKVDYKTDIFTYLSSWGFFDDFPIYSFIDEINVENLKEIYEKIKFLFPIDGLVINKNSVIRSGKDIIENMIAYKFEGETGVGLVEDIIWKTGISGRVIPVVKLKKPIFICQANIQNITAHNAQYIKDNGLNRNSLITVIRSGDVIPYIRNVLQEQEVDLPERCLVCGFPLDWESVHLVCNNLDCPARIKGNILKILEISGIPDGLGPNTLEEWINKYKTVSLVCELVEYLKNVNKEKRLEDNQNLFGNHYGKLITELEYNLLKKFNNNFTISEFWYICNLTGLGKSASYALRKVVPETFLLSEINTLDVPINIKNELYRKYDFWNLLSKIIPISNEQLEERKIKYSVAVTGKLSMPRNRFEKILNENGISLGTISKNTKYLITNESSSSSKYLKAKKHGIPIITELDFIKMITKKQEEE